MYITGSPLATWNIDGYILRGIYTYTAPESYRIRSVSLTTVNATLHERYCLCASARLYEWIRVHMYMQKFCPRSPKDLHCDICVSCARSANSNFRLPIPTHAVICTWKLCRQKASALSLSQSDFGRKLSCDMYMLASKSNGVNFQLRFSDTTTAARCNQETS